MVVAQLIGECNVQLWFLSNRERITRQLKSLGISLLSDGMKPPETGTCLLVRGDYLFELGTFRSLTEKESLLLLDDDSRILVAAWVPAGRAREVAGRMQAQYERGDDSLAISSDNPASMVAGADPLADLPSGTREALGVYDAKLRRADPPMLEKLSPERAPWLEDQLYGNAYKGVTDLVTKFLWPRPAKKLVRVCAARGITPNQVTWLSFALVLLAGWFFWQAQFALGLVAGWVMTLLDTVDGKLARVRVEASKLGHLFDHGIDLIHPPFWYWLWGMGLERQGEELPLTLLVVLIFIAYIAGRLAELGFQKLCGGSIFAWQPFDSWFRLITARRNPCLIILTASLLAGAPVAGLWAVMVWTVLTTAVLGLRLVQGLAARRHQGSRLLSWLASPDAARNNPRSYSVFAGTRSAYQR